jgi:hypothetical protein
LGEQLDTGQRLSVSLRFRAFQLNDEEA